MPELILKLGDQVLQTYVIEGETINIGRSRDNDIVIENLGVSRNHARIRFHNNRYVLTDMNSANGTLVNGVKVSKTEIVDDDVVSIGKHKIHFRHAAAEDAALGGGFEAEHTVMVDPAQGAALVATEGRIKGREFQLSKFETTIGKAAGNDVVLSEEWWLAKKQAIIVRRGNSEFEIHDLGSIRKIRVNSSPITQPVILRNGDVIDVGNVRFMFRTGDQPLIPTGRMPHEIEMDDSVFEGAEHGRVDTASYPAAVGVAGALASHRTPPPEFPSFVARGAAHEVEPDDNQPEFKSMRFDSNDLLKAALKVHGGEKLLDEVTPPSNDSVVVAEETGDESVTPEPVVPAQEPSLEKKSTQPLAPVNAPAPAGESPDAGQLSAGRLSRRKRRELERKKQQQQQKQANSSGGGQALDQSGQSPRAGTAGSTTKNTGSSDSEVALWESALANPSPVIRRQAARMLKKLTGRDYDV